MSRLLCGVCLHPSQSHYMGGPCPHCGHRWWPKDQDPAPRTVPLTAINVPPLHPLDTLPPEPWPWWELDPEAVGPIVLPIPKAHTRASALPPT